MRKSTDIIVIGGGVIGCSIAYELAIRGAAVQVFEREQIAGGASGAAAGMLAAQAEFITEASLLQLALKSRAMFPRLVKELKSRTGLEVGLIEHGLLRIARDSENAAKYSAYAEQQRQLGLIADWLGPGETQELEPSLTGIFTGSLHLPRDSQVIAPQLTFAYAAAAKSLGAEFREYSEVQQLLYDGGRISGVRIRDEVIACRQVVVASSIQSSRLLQSAGYDLPLYPVKGECIAVRPTGPPLRRTIYTDRCYLVPKANGELLIGATVKPGRVDSQVRLDGISTLIDEARQLIPALDQAEWLRCWSGLRPQTQTGLPYMGEHPEIEGLFIAAGHYRNGILLSPITGAIIADLIEAKPPAEDIADFAVPAIIYQ